MRTRCPLDYAFALSSVKGLGNVRIKRLITHFGSVQAVFDAKPADIAQLPSLTPARIRTVTGDLPTFREKLDTLRSQNIRVLCLEEPVYPVHLKAIPDPPAILCSLGEFTAFDVPCVAIVGTRQPTAEGIELTLELATACVLAGFTVVSGLAQGIDTFAHAGALAGAGKTIAVLGTDVLNGLSGEKSAVGDGYLRTRVSTLRTSVPNLAIRSDTCSAEPYHQRTLTGNSRD